jgi:hypothetical protein
MLMRKRSAHANDDSDGARASPQKWLRRLVVSPARQTYSKFTHILALAVVSNSFGARSRVREDSLLPLTLVGRCLARTACLAGLPGRLVSAAYLHPAPLRWSACVCWSETSSLPWACLTTRTKPARALSS